MRPADMIMKVGAKHYPTVASYIVEAQVRGASKRLPSVPTGAVQDVTRIFLAHPRAIVSMQGKPRDLLAELGTLAEVNSVVSDALLSSYYHRLPDVLAQVADTGDSAARAILKRYGVKFHIGIFGYFYIAQLQGVVDSQDADVDEVLRRAGVVPVFVVREGEDGL